MRVKRSLAALASLPLLAATLAGCGGAAETFQESAGAHATAGDLEIRNVTLVGDGDGGASLIAYFSNSSQRDDRLREMRVDGQPVSLPLPVEIPAESSVSIGGSGDTKVQVDNLDVELGRFAPVELIFARAPQTSLEVLVVPAQGTYEDLGPTPAPSPTTSG